MNFFKLPGRSLILLQSISVLLVLFLGCGGHRSASESENRELGDQLVPSRVVYSAKSDFDCYSERMGGYRREQLKVGRNLGEKDLVVLAALFNDVVAPDLTIDEGRSGQIPRFIVSLATQDEHDIVPTEEFLQSLKSDGFQ